MNGCAPWEPRSSGWMGRQRGSRAAGQRGSASSKTHSRNTSDDTLAEALLPGVIPQYEIPGWREEYGVVGGITGRGSEPGRGFDLGLWSDQPVGEVMSRWLAFRRSMDDFVAVALGNQVHGVELMNLEAGRGWVYVDGIDGWITTTAGILLTVTIADCIPVYLVAPGKGVALLHAGWRGTAGGILGAGIARLASATVVSPSQLLMHCGVGICGQCYEVGPEVMRSFGVPHAPDGAGHLDLRQHLLQQARRLR